MDGAAAVDAQNAPTAAWKTHSTRFPHRPPPYSYSGKNTTKTVSRLRASKESDDTHATYRVAGFETFLTGRILTFGDTERKGRTMKKRFTEAQIVGFLREADAGVPVKELEIENTRLKKLLADALLENEVTREVLRKKW